MQPRCVADYACHTGEGPLWNPFDRRLYWVDIPRGRLFRYDPATGAHEQCLEAVTTDGTPDAIGGFTVQSDGTLLLFMARGSVRLWRDGFLGTIIESLPEELDSRFNDVIADPAGRVFCGTMTSPGHPGRLYRLDTDGSLHVVLEGQGCPNGMGFTLDLKQMYYTDSVPGLIYRFDYDLASGQLSNQRVFAEVPKSLGSPDGMTVDANGHVWSARWDGSRLVEYDTQGRELRQIVFPARKVSSVVFGGADYATLYVTTAGGHDRPAEGEGAGGLYALRPGVTGKAEYMSMILVGN